jgi:hypothetical protein
MPKEDEGKQGQGAGGTAETGGTDYKALYEKAQADAERWKQQARKNEGRAKSNAQAAKDLGDAEQQMGEIRKRLDELEAENASLKAEKERSALVAKVADETGVPESIVQSLSASDEEGLTQAAKAISDAFKTPGGAPGAPEAGTFPKGESDGEGTDWLREALENK